MDEYQGSEPAGWPERAHSVTDVLKSATSRIEAARELPGDVMAALVDAGLFRLLLPRSIGGAELDLATLAEVTRIVAAADASAAWCIGQGAGCAMSAAFLDADTARELFGPRNAVLAWGAGVAGTAREMPGGYLVNGTWSFASGSRHATLLGGHCKVIAPDGQPRLRADGRPADRTALVRRDQAVVHDVWHVVGLRGTGSDSYELRDVFVPNAHTIDRETLSSAMVSGPLYKFPTTMAYAAAFGGVMLGISRGMLDDLRALALTKTARGAVSSLLDSATFHLDLARLEARWRALRAYHLSTYRDIWTAVEAGAPLTLDQRMAARMTATHVISEGCQIAVEGYRQAGQNAIFEAAPFERRLRDALSASQQVQGRASHFVTAGRHLLGLPPDTTMFI